MASARLAVPSETFHFDLPTRWRRVLGHVADVIEARRPGDLGDVVVVWCTHEKGPERGCFVPHSEPPSNFQAFGGSHICVINGLERIPVRFAHSLHGERNFYIPAR